MRRKQLNTTLSKEQIRFMTENKNKYSRSEMAVRFKCSIGKISENARIAGIEFPQRNRFGVKKRGLVVEGDFFNVNRYDNWLLGFNRGKVY